MNKKQNQAGEHISEGSFKDKGPETDTQSQYALPEGLRKLMGGRGSKH
jgi:hypothetical protein